MVYIKSVELTHFKSFGGTMDIPLLPGFTVVSGPNGSGKSNILDALLFCLGLASSKGMRAERLPDLVNNSQSKTGRTTETIVSVTFDIEDLEDKTSLFPEQTPLNEWTVSRRLRVTKEGNYSSTYYMNSSPCTVTELHEQLNRLRIYPEGYNVVLQGDVTRIISMNAKERREIIDELAGVAEFDRKIEQAKKTLDSVREREERNQIIEQELIRNMERLANDRIKAEKYQKLREKLIERQQWELVLVWKSLQQQYQNLETQITQDQEQIVSFNQQLVTVDQTILETNKTFEELNALVKSLGEEEQLSISSHLASQKAKKHQLQLRQNDLNFQLQETDQIQTQSRIEINQLHQELEQLSQEKHILETQSLQHLIQERDQAKTLLETNRKKANTIASASEAWVQEQSNLTREIRAIQNIINPQQTQKAQLTERTHQLTQKIIEQTQQLIGLEMEIADKNSLTQQWGEQLTLSQQKVQDIAEQLSTLEQEKKLAEDTLDRLQKEQREKQRQLDKLEAKKQAEQEAQGTYATKIILTADIAGVHGLVAQLGQVEPRYQLALEIAAGTRLGYIVVEDDLIASIGIDLLKQKKAGRATFLPLTKINPPSFNESKALKYAEGFIDLAVNLVTCESRFSRIFGYVFGNTAVFENLNSARPFLGQQRIVTLEGELLESTGAMTGGSTPSRSNLRFGTISSEDSEEITQLRDRLQDVDRILIRCQESLLDKAQIVKELSQKLIESRQQTREQQLQWEQLHRDLDKLIPEKDKLSTQFNQNQQELNTTQTQLQKISDELPIFENQLFNLQQQLHQLEAEQTHHEWQIIQQEIKQQEKDLQQKEQSLRHAENRLQEILNKDTRLSEKIIQSEEKLKTAQNKHADLIHTQLTITQQISELDQQIQETEITLQHLTEKLSEEKKKRDQAEQYLRELRDRHQQLSWKLQKLQESQTEKQTKLEELQAQLELQQQELPDPLPELPPIKLEENGQEINSESNNYTTQLEQIQKEIRTLQKRLQSLEPVNMLALEEYNRTEERLNELSERLKTIEAERTEILLRVETFTTLRYRAFKDAFDAVNENFKTIFATLSEGDGYLQLDNPENPFEGGLNLVAHPKGKPVQRLSSMSGGEKSLTALSFIFSLQRYRPSPFYAFDEVDMFLDGANVEKLSKMIQKQAKEAQFIVVSLRRPMIEASQRTIGVTQARGGYTQVIGIKLS